MIYNTCQLLQALKKQCLITSEDIQHSGQAQKQKIYRRQPFLKDTSDKPQNREEETALFHKLKNKC